MAVRPPEQRGQDSREALVAALENRLGTLMGVRLTPLERLIRSRAPVPLALALLLLQGAGARHDREGQRPAPHNPAIVIRWFRA